MHANCGLEALSFVNPVCVSYHFCGEHCRNIYTYLKIPNHMLAASNTTFFSEPSDDWKAQEAVE